MSLILVATVARVLLERFRRLPAGRTCGVRRGGARDTAGNGERAAHRRVRPTIMPDEGPRPPPASQARPEPLAGATRSHSRRALVGLVKHPVPLTPRKLGVSLWTGPARHCLRRRRAVTRP